MSSTNDTTLSPAWTFPGSFGLPATPLVVAGDRLLGISSSAVFAVDIHTGAPAATSTPDRDWLQPIESFFGPTPKVAAADGIVYMTDGDDLKAIGLGDGDPLPGWSMPKVPGVAALTVHEGTLIAVHLNSSGATVVSGFAASTGLPSFAPRTISPESPGSVTFGNGAVFFMAEGALHAVNVDFGDPRWRFAPAGDPLTAAVAPLVADRTVLVSGRTLYAVDIEKGTKRFEITSTAGRDVTWSTPAADIPPAPVAASQAANFQLSTGLQDSRNGALLTGTALAAAILGRTYGGRAVATSSAGDVVCFALSDGAMLWRTTANSPGAPVIIDDTVYVTTDGQARLARFNVHTGQRLSGYLLPELADSQQPTIANGSLFLTSDAGDIVARPFATQSAAFFDGASSLIAVKPEGTQFDFGTEDFTLEAWFRSSTGGEILSTYPTSTDPGAHGIRVNLTPAGQVRVAVTNAGRSSYAVRRTRRAGAADGEWHHLAVVRRSGAFMVAVDGRSHDVLAPEGATDNALSIGGRSALTIGAYKASATAAPDSYFRGLIREVRIWDRALDLSTIANNKSVQLTGAEPRLKGLWRLAEAQTPEAPVEPVNEVRRHRVRATFVNAASRPTDLTMDGSAFPYLLHESKRQWPYAGTWAARGATAVRGSAAVSSNGIAAYGTSSAIYAVDAHDGKRVWGMDVVQASEPVADGGDFLVLTKAESLIRLDARRGGKLQLTAFPPCSATGRLVAPACSASHIAATMGGNTVWIWDRAAAKAKSVAVDGAPERLVFGSAGLVVVTRGAAGVRLVLINPMTAAVRGTASVSGDACCMAGDSLFAVVDGAVARFDGASISAPPKVKSARLGGTITGLLALGDDATIVATTDAGVVHGLTLGGLPRWNTPLPVGRAGGTNAVNPPALESGHRVVCTTASGTVAVLDGRTGAIAGLYSTMHAAIGTPAIAAGTVFTGCVDVIANDDLAEIDGALHSIVFGETTTLRLNVDAAGTPVANGRQHADITVAGDDSALRLLNVHESCVEAWVNLPAPSKGGGILGIAPTTRSRFDVNLWIEPDGTLHYTSRVLDGTAWSAVHVAAATTIIDGKWHHVAASRSLATSQANSNDSVPDRVIIYVDGVAMPTNVVAPPAAPATLATGLRACVGATLDAALAASRPFCGMIAEARVWDTYLVSSEISSRMSVKLRGDEPGLIAYWNFDLGRVADASRDGHDGELAVAVSAAAPAWWLTDLTFAQPSYPFITSTAAIASQKEGERTMYALTIKVCSADGKGMGGQDVHAWYVKRAADDAASIFVNEVELQAVTSDDEPHPKVLRLQKAFSGKTLSDGTLRLRVSSPLAGHGPALDLWTAFMPLNERFHVDVLIDNQSLAKPTPPALTAQAKLIQDYHYTTGNKVDETRDRSTWRVVLRAADPGDVPRPDEPVTLWASESATIEVLGQKHVVNADNAVTVTTEPTGELTVVMTASGLTAPTLYARAGFMHRNDRVVIDPHQDAHAQLNTLDSAQLTKPRMTNWKPGAKEDEGPTLLKSEHQTYAPDIAKAIRQVTTVAKPADPHAPPRAGRLLRAARAPRLAMRQPATVPLTDGVVLRRTLAGVARPAPVDADAFRDAMHGALGFMIETGPRGFVYTPITTPAQLAMIRADEPPMLARPDQLLGAFWDDIVDFAVDVYDQAKRIVVTVADAVQIAITTLVDQTTRIVNIVVDSVEKALDAVAGFFKQLAVELEKVIEFLRVIFNWKAIIETQKILHQVFLASANMAIASTKDMGKFTNATAALAKLPVAGVPADAPSMNSASAGPGSQNDPVVAGSRSVEGKSMMQKTTTSPVQSSASASPAAALPQPSNPLEVILRELPALASSVLDLSPADLVSEMQRILAKVADATLVTTSQTIAAVVKGFGEPVKWVIDLLNARINIPFITDLYEWITGTTLTLANVICLVLAIPVNIAYAAITLIKDGRARKFADDAKGLPAEMVKPRLAAAADVAVVPATPIAPEVVFVIFRAITCIADSSLDAAALSKARAKGGDGFLGDKAIGIFKIMSGVAGMVTLTIQNVFSNKAFEVRVRAVAGKDADQFLPPWEWLTWTIYGVLMALRLKNIVVGGMALRTAGPSKSDPTLVMIERVATQAASFVALPLLIIQIVQLEKLKPIIQGFGNANVAEEYRLMAIRDIMGTVGLMFELFFSTTDLEQVGSVAPPPGWDFHGFAVNVRAATGATATVLHAVAVFGYGD